MSGLVLGIVGQNPGPPGLKVQNAGSDGTAATGMAGWWRMTDWVRMADGFAIVLIGGNSIGPLLPPALRGLLRCALRDGDALDVGRG